MWLMCALNRILLPFVSNIIVCDPTKIPNNDLVMALAVGAGQQISKSKKNVSFSL